MPEGVGKAQAAFERRFPRISQFGHDYSTTIQAVLIAGLISLIGYIGYTAVTAGEKAGDAKDEIRVLTQTPCKEALTNPKKLPACRESFHAASKLIGPAVACQLVKKGVSWLVVDGHRVGGETELECIPPPAVAAKEEGATGAAGPTGEQPSSTGSSTQSGGGVDDVGGETSPGGRPGPPKGGRGGNSNPPSTSPPASAPTAPRTEAPAAVPSESAPGTEGPVTTPPGQPPVVGVKTEGLPVEPHLCVNALGKPILGVNC